MRAHPHRDRRLPTRVSTACDRCRRRKQRCDDRRPCSNCTSVDFVCTSTWAPTIKRPRPLNRTSASSSVPESVSHALEDHGSSLDTKLGQRISICSDDQYPQNDLNVRVEPAKGLETPVTNQSQAMQTSPASITSSDTRTRRVRAISDFEEGGSTASITKQIFDNESSNSYRNRETFAIPGADVPESRAGSREHHLCMSISEVLGVDLPPTYACDTILETYFQTVHWFSLVVYEPTFRARYREIVDSGSANVSDRSFLLLLAMILIMGSWYRSEGSVFDHNNMPYNLTTMRNKFLKLIRSHFMDLMDEDSLEFVQLSTLLGSFYLYHSRPRAAFSILGAATKTAQAMRLHHESYEGFSFEKKEERKRVWWTIYTWDRFAAIIYGRPLGVNDRDCNVSMPSLFDENITFDPTLGPSKVCLSAYQIQLNMVYRIASPVLENLYTIRHSQDSSQMTENSVIIAEVDRALKQWRAELPPFLDFSTIRDVGTGSTAEEKAHSLQAFSLQLTYDNLVMVVNRPLLADSVSLTSPSLPSTSNRWTNLAQERSADTQGNLEQRKVACRRCFDSALSISRVQSKGSLVQLAQQTHLISFIGINLFTASVVLYICARSNILSDLAQEAKRGMSRILHLQKVLSTRASLSMQCSVILEDLLQLVLEKEKEALLSSDFNDDYTAASNSENRASTAFHNAPDRLEGSNLAHTGSVDAGGVLNPAWPAEMGDLSYHNDYLRESLISLQRVVQENVFDPQVVSESQASFAASADMPVGGNWRCPDHLAYCNNISEAGGRIEDLGQFWLWDL